MLKKNNQASIDTNWLPGKKKDYIYILDLEVTACISWAFPGKALSRDTFNNAFASKIVEIYQTD